MPSSSHRLSPSWSRPAEGGRDVPPPAVRIAPLDERAAAARVAPALRTARDLVRWVGESRRVTAAGVLPPSDAAAAGAALDLSPAEVTAAWTVAVGADMLAVADGVARPGARSEVLRGGSDDDVLAAWTAALRAVLDTAALDDLATVLYTTGGLMRIDTLFEIYAQAGEQRTQCGAGPASEEEAAEPAAALEMLADLGAVEVDDEATEAGGLTVSLSPLGVWGVRERLAARGWRAPAHQPGAAADAAAVLAMLGEVSAEVGESELAAWLARRTGGQAAAELVAAALGGTPALRGAAFAVLDRVGVAAIPAVRAALDDPALRPHAAVWLSEHGEQVPLTADDRAWLLVDLGAGLLEDADPADVAADLLPDLPSGPQVDLVADLWRVDHPDLLLLLAALSDRHPDAAVARAARKAALKARSRA